MDFPVVMAFVKVYEHFYDCFVYTDLHHVIFGLQLHGSHFYSWFSKRHSHPVYDEPSIPSRENRVFVFRAKLFAEVEISWKKEVRR